MKYEKETISHFSLLTSHFSLLTSHFSLLTSHFALILFSVILLASCSLFDSGDDSDYIEGKKIENTVTPASSESVRLRIGVEEGGARSILPKDKIEGLTLKGSLAGGTENILVNADTKSPLENLSKEEMEASSIELLCGSWTFTMTGVVGDVTFKAVLEKEIKKDGDTSLVFNMKPFDSEGNEITTGTLKFSLAFDFTGNTDKLYAFLTVKKLGETSAPVTKEYSFTVEEGAESSGKIEYPKDSSDQKNFEGGTYDITIDFYGDREKKVKLNNWEAYARIVPGYVSKAEITGYSLNEVYSITVHNIEDTDSITPSSASVIPLKYSRKSEEIILPDYTREDWYFAGWYTEEPYVNSITSIAPDLCKNIDVYARWRSTTIWVKEGGEGHGEREDLAVPSLEKACQMIDQVYTLAKTLTEIKGGTYEKEVFTIKICGEVKGKQELPSSLSTTKVKSVTIEGANGLDGDGVPKDSLNGNSGGTTLTIKTAVPVTIKNLKITGGNADNGGGIYNNKKLTLSNGCVVMGNTAKQAAGIYNNDTLILNGASIESNTAETYGGGIYNNASAEIFVYGSTNIKKNTCTSSGFAYGGAVYNASSLYLGFNEEKKKTAWSGEFSGNKATQGSAIWSAGGASICFDSGTIKNNVSSVKWGILLMGTGSLELSGSARIDSTDPVYFCPYGAENTFPTFKVTGTLSAESPVATFIMKSGFWKRGQTILTAGDGVTLTKDITKKFSFTEEGWELFPESDGKTAYMDFPVYVAGSGRAVCEADGNDTSGKGSMAKPFATIEKAVGILNDSTIDYTIYIDGKISGAQKIPSNFTTTKAKTVTIKGVNGFDGDGVPNDSLDGGFTLNSKGCTLTISSGVPVTIRNLKITGGYNTEETTGKGGGIYISESGASVELGDGTLITKNTARLGGGIYNTGTLTITGGIISENSTNSKGGGLYVNQYGTCKMTGGNICSNYSSGAGGGIFLYGEGSLNAKFFMSGSAVIGDSNADSTATSSLRSNFSRNDGGAIAVGSATAYIGYIDEETPDTDYTGGIYYNYARDKGGAIYLSSTGKCYIAGGTITLNGTSDTGMGKGLYNANELYLKNNACFATTDDVYLASGKYITITGELESTTTVAKIVPSTCAESVRVLKLDSDPEPATTLLSEYKKFEVAADESTKYYIASDGRIFSTKPATHFTTVPASGTTAGLATMDDFEKVAEWVDDGNELTGVTLSLLSDVTLDSTFTPVGEYYSDYEVNKQGKVRKVFTGGIFEGNNKTITYDNASFTQKYSGIFSGAKNATIQNLNLEGTLNVNADYAGCVIGHAEACIVKNCSSSVTITSESSQYGIGGIIGDAEGTSVSGKTYYNERDCYILDCVNTGSITGSASGYVGGIAGSATACIIRNCINKGNITGAKCCGGIVGVTSGSGPNSYGNLIENCGNNGNVSVTSSGYYDSGAGGIAGGPSANNGDWYPHINNCYSSGTVTCVYMSPGGIFGYAKDKCVLSKCYYYNPNQACSNGNPSGSSKYTSVSSILNDMNSLNSSDSAKYRKWKVSGSVLEFEE